MATVVHPFLTDGVEARAYQMRALRSALTSSTLMVMPTGFGKTAVEWMAMAEALRLKRGKVLLIAPTTGLVDQQRRMAMEMLAVDNDSIITYTGEISPAKRPPLWESGSVIMATSQVIRNDATTGTIDLSEVGLLIVDEAHHSTGNHAYAQVGDLYLSANPEALVLGATASPGSTESHILEVARRLGIERLDVCKKEDPLLGPYTVKLDNIPHRLTLPPELNALLHPLQAHQDEEAEHLRRLGFLAPTGHLSSKLIEEAQRRASTAIQRRDRRGYDAARRIGDLRRTHLLLDLLRTQGTTSALSFLQRAEDDGRTGERTTNRFVGLPAIHAFRTAGKDVGELHPKPAYVQTLVEKQRTENPDSKILIFTEYRDTVEHLVKRLSSLEGINVDKFIGQSGKGKRKGMTQKEQLAQLNRFREGDLNILVATSVGEEGLDVPAADLVILYEPVASAIRAIQRRGRTARQRAGSVHTLIAAETRDEYVNIAAERREAKMYTLLQRIHDRGRLPRRPPPPQDVLQAFTVVHDGIEHTPQAFIEAETDRLTPEPEAEGPPGESIEGASKKKLSPVLSPIDQRPRQQMGLDQFVTPAEQKKAKTPSTESVPASGSEQSGPVLDGKAHREREQLAAAAAAASITAMQAGTVPKASIILDHREANSSLAPHLKSMGAHVAFKHLISGDIRLSERVLIERKTARDLVSSLSDGRLLHQCRRLNAAALRPLLLVEIGDGHGQAVHPDAVHGALAYISLDLGMPVMMTKNPEETARFLVAAARREHDVMERWAFESLQRAPNLDDERAIERATSAAAAEIKAIELGEDATAPLGQRWPNHAKEEQTAVLASIAGVGPTRAAALIDAFGNIAGVFAASKEALLGAKNIGATTAMSVYQILHEG
ncbi:MAG: helicase-related protein [Euryarchaeota archaeon]